MYNMRMWYAYCFILLLKENHQHAFSSLLQDPSLHGNSFKPHSWHNSEIIFIFRSRVFERKYASSFPDKWILIIYQVIRSEYKLNWGELISSNLISNWRKYRKNTSFSALHTYWMWCMVAESILLLIGDGSLTFH